MDPERWKRVDDIFQAALNHEPSARAAYLEVECKNDDTLRTEVEQLIANHEKQSSLFENPATDLAAAFFAEQGMHKDTIAHYKIIKKIGSGGMGDVYLAEDTRLNRNVAIKVLPSEFTKDKERIRRFEREARALSALNHPYILTVHDIGQIDSSTFIVSEYIEGETLRHQMRASKIPLKEILTIVIQVAEALDAAHRVAIIHRDIKPENIMLRHDGYVKLLDFGLSKSIETEITSEVSNLET
ncbi:MAG TPA: serine/threonine-protein kinase, partial [Acidobacteriota bacterium]|nr:serine/threonine-protein kinase [Acidobacteriota bacterium]